MPFCGRASVVTSRIYRHPESGREFSAFSCWHEPGCVPIDRGFTIQWGDGTVGTCRAPFATREEAQAFADNWNARTGFGE